MKKELVIFETLDKEISLSVEILKNTVWLTQNQMAELFKTTKQNISLHANNCFKEGELDKKSVVKESLTTAADGKNYKTKLYNLDVIISIGYRVKSKRGVEFRQWANEILKQYILKGYVVNKKRLQALEKTVDIQTKMLANALDVEEADILKAVNEYTDALLLLDQYDHQALKKPSGKMPTYRITCTVFIIMKIFYKRKYPFLHDHIHSVCRKIMEYGPFQLTSVNCSLTYFYFSGKNTLKWQAKHCTFSCTHIIGIIQIMNKHQVCNLFDYFQWIDKSSCRKYIP